MELDQQTLTEKKRKRRRNPTSKESQDNKKLKVSEEIEVIGTVPAPATSEANTDLTENSISPSVI